MKEIGINYEEMLVPYLLLVIVHFYELGMANLKMYAKKVLGFRTKFLRPIT